MGRETNVSLSRWNLASKTVVVKVKSARSVPAMILKIPLRAMSFTAVNGYQ